MHSLSSSHKASQSRRSMFRSSWHLKYSIFVNRSCMFFGGLLAFYQGTSHPSESINSQIVAKKELWSGDRRQDLAPQERLLVKDMGLPVSHKYFLPHTELTARLVVYFSISSANTSCFTFCQAQKSSIVRKSGILIIFYCVFVHKLIRWQGAFRSVTIGELGQLRGWAYLLSRPLAQFTLLQVVHVGLSFCAPFTPLRVVPQTCLPQRL